MRVLLFVLTNFAVLLVASVTLRLLGVEPWLNANGINFNSLLIFGALLGFGGAFLSLALSKWTAKRAMGVQVIAQPRNEQEAWLLETVRRLAGQAGIGMPEVGYFDSPAPNAFATGARRDSALVAVSTGLVERMSRKEVEAVLGHEVSHVANGDMVTLTLIQGVVNTFVFFLSRVVGYIVDRAIFKTERGTGPGYMITVIVCQIVFGIAASLIVAWFSRQREFRADAASATYLNNSRPMINALRRLGGLAPGELPRSFESSGITGGGGFGALFSTHPPIEVRIAALEARRG